MKTLPLGIAAVMMTASVAFAQTGTTNTTPAPAVSNPPAVAPGPGVTTPVVPGAGTTTGTTPPLSSNNNSSTTPPAVTTSQAPSKTSAAPVKGRNSFTQREATRRIAAGGFTQVSGLRKDRDGIWRGKAMKDGASVNVFCDYQGNVGAS